MSNLDVIKAHYAASDRGDLDGMLAVLAPDARWNEMAGFPYAGTYVGADEVRTNVFERIAADWDGYTASITELLDAGDTIVGLGEYSGTCRKTRYPDASPRRPRVAALARACRVLRAVHRHAPRGPGHGADLEPTKSTTEGTR